MGFAPEYIASVLAENFDDAKRLLLQPLMAIHYAHLVMLADRGIVGPDEARHLRNALDGIDLEGVAGAKYDGRHEDLFCYVNALIEAAVGLDVAGRLQALAEGIAALRRNHPNFRLLKGETSAVGCAKKVYPMMVAIWPRAGRF